MSFVSVRYFHLQEFFAVARNNRFLHLLPFLLYPVALTWAVRNDPFFWDSIQLGSKHAHFFYENGLRWLPLPEQIDSGHPPVFGYYLACIWTFLGKTLPLSHMAMLPFLIGIVLMLYRLGRRFGGESLAFWLLPLVLLDPVMAGQSVMISPDVVLACGFLCAVEGLSGNNRRLAGVGIFLLCMISVRGMMTAGALAAWTGLTGFVLPAWRSKAGVASLARNLGLFVLHRAPVFLPGFAFAGWFLWWHHQVTGWTGLHPASPWAPTFEPARGIALLRNALIIGWRWLDFGRVFEWLLLFVLLWKSGLLKKKPVADLAVLLVCLVIFLSPSTLLFVNVSAHRYALPGFLALHLLFFQSFVQFFRTRPRLLGARPVLPVAILVVCFALGNLWIYPRGVAMGWDATLSHLPFHRLRREATAYLEARNIDFADVGSTFPNLNSGELMMLDGDQRRFSDKDFVQNRYFMASNIFNDLSDSDFRILESEWVLEKKWQQAGVWIELYRKN